MRIDSFTKVLEAVAELGPSPGAAATLAVNLADETVTGATTTFLSAAANVRILLCSVVVMVSVFFVLVVVLVLTAVFGRGSTSNQAYQVLRLLRPSSIRIPWLQMGWRDEPARPPTPPAEDPANRENS